jgi:hypothetical protein
MSDCTGGDSPEWMEILERVYRKGVTLWTDRGQLCYRAPKGSLTADEIATLRNARHELIGFLQGNEAGAAPSSSDHKLRTAPLSFSQLVHWRTYRLQEQPAIRQIASASRLTGKMNPEVLREAIGEIVLRHDALRTRIVLREATPSLQVLASASVQQFELKDLSGLAVQNQEREALKEIDDLIMEPIEVFGGPLFGTKLLKLAAEEHILIVAMEHMISDATSREILVSEALAVYSQLVGGQRPALPRVAMQFTTFAQRQRHETALWTARHGTYWKEYCKSAQRLRFPCDVAGDGGVSAASRASIGIFVGQDFRQALMQWSRKRHTTLALTCFCAYVALVLRWCSVSVVHIQYMTDGRGPETENAIGYFAAPLHLQVASSLEDDFVVLLERVTEAYCRAHEHADCWRMAAEVPRPGFTFGPAFNWIAAGSQTKTDVRWAASNLLVRTPVSFVHPMLRTAGPDSEPSITLYDNGNQITGYLRFTSPRHAHCSMERFLRNWRLFMNVLLTEPARRVRDVPLV